MIPHAPWWMYVVASVYALALCFNVWQEAFGPSGAGMRPVEPGLTVARVAGGSPLDTAGVRIGDVIEAVDGRPTAGMSDWFVVRANFERNRRTPIQVRRGGQYVSLWFTITKPNWRTWNPAIVAAEAARVIVLLLALVVAFSLPGQPSARLAALIFAMIAVAEGYPSAGWAAGLRHLPVVLSIPIALATVSWLLMPTVWLSLCAVFPEPLFTRRWQWAVGVAPLAIFAPLLVTSAFALVYAPAVLAMPSPFADSIATKRIGEIMGIVPQLFVNLWPAYRPSREAWLLELWFVISISFLLTGFVMMIVNSRRLSDAAERRQMRVVLVALGMVWVIGIHNVLVRNWATFFDGTPPALFSRTGDVAEAIVFPFVALALGYAVLRHRLPQRTSA